MENKYEMNLKRAIKLMVMPREWFNTTEKIELRKRAREFINKNKDMQNIFRGKVTVDERLGAANEGEQLFKKEVKEIEAYREADEQVKKQKESHNVDNCVLAAKNITDKYALIVPCENVAIDAAKASIKLGFNSATMLSSGSHSRKEGTLLDDFEKYLTSAVTELEGKREKESDKKGKNKKGKNKKGKNKKGKNKDFSEMDRDIQELKNYLETVKNLKKQVELLNIVEERNRKNAAEPLIKKQNEYDKSIKAVCEQLGYKYAREEFTGDGIEYFAKNKRSAELERFFQELAMSLSYGIEDKKYVKEIPSYRTPTKGKIDMPKKEDDEIDR